MKRTPEKLRELLLFIANGTNIKKDTVVRRFASDMNLSVRTVYYWIKIAVARR